MCALLRGQRYNKTTTATTCILSNAYILTGTNFEQAMIESGQGAAQANIGNKDIENYCFLCPQSLNEQHRIAMSLSSVEKTIRYYSDKIFLLNQYKKGLMQQLFPTSK